MPATDLDQIVNLCKRRGFVFPSAEIYGGFRSHLRLRPARRRCCCATSRTRGGGRWCSSATTSCCIDAAILGPPQVWEAVGHLANFTDPLVDCTNCKQRFRLDKLDDPNTCPNCGAHGHVHRGPPVQPDVQDPRRPGRGRRRRRLPAPRDGAGHVRQLRQRAADHAARSRRSASPRSASVPQRDHAAELRSSAPASSSRWRWSSSCRRPTAPQWYEYWCTERLQLVRRPRHPAPTCCACAPHDADELSHYSAGHVRRRVPVPVGLGRARGHRPAHRLRPQRSTPTHSRREARLLRPGRPTSATCRTSSSRPPAPPARWRRSCSRPTTRTRSTARRAPCCASTRASRRTRSPCCRCRRRTR